MHIINIHQRNIIMFNLGEDYNYICKNITQLRDLVTILLRK